MSGMIKIFYYLLLGDLGDYREINSTDSGPLMFAFLVIVTVLLVIIMLNLLISIISDSFSKVMALDLQSRNFERLHVTQEVDYMMGGDYLVKEGDSFIYFVTDTAIDETDDQQKILTKIGHIDAKLRNFEILYTKIDERVERFESILLGLDKKLDNIRK